MIGVDLSKQQELNTHPKAIQQINFTANLDRARNTRIYFILEEAKETVSEFSQGAVKVLFSVKLNFDQYKMTQYNSLNVTLSNSQLSKLRSAVKNEALKEVVLKLYSNMIGDNEPNFPHKILLTNR